MNNEIRSIYFETSAVNYLFDNVFNKRDFSSIETKKLQLQKQRRWYISIITLWEIFLTKDQDRRYNLFDFSRCLFYDFLIPSPEEIIINYIKSGCPEREAPYEFKSQSLFAKEWAFACKNLDYEFQPDREQIESYTHHFRFIGEYFLKVKKGYRLRPLYASNEASNKINSAYLQHIFKYLLEIHGGTPDENEKHFIAVSLQLTMIILCYGIAFDQLTIEAFWNKDKQMEPLERLEYTIKHYPDIFFRGPIVNIAKMIIMQSGNKSGRGVYFDSLHAIYTTYSQLYVSNDAHFLNYKMFNSQDPNMHKIIDVKDLQFFTP